LPTLETIDAALAPLALKHGVGVCAADPSADHYVLVPDYERSFEADNGDYFVDEHVNIEFYIGGDYRPAVRSAKTLLKAAGLFVLDGNYIGYETDTKRHHYALPVVGRV
jgi:hypothetical protein